MNPQAIKIYEILKDGNWHCPIEWNYADGHCKRITDINLYLAPRGQKIASSVCDCGRHTSKILKRRIVPLEGKIDQIHPLERPLYETYKQAITYCCGDRLRGLQTHSKDCKWNNLSLKEKADSLTFEQMDNALF